MSRAQLARAVLWISGARRGLVSEATETSVGKGLIDQDEEGRYTVAKALIKAYEEAKD